VSWGRRLVAIGEAHGDGHAGLHDAVVRGCLADAGTVQQLGQLADARLLLALLLLGGVVAAVLAKVTLLARGLDPGGQLVATFARHVVELGLEPVVRLLGQPGDDLARTRHGNSFGAPRCRESRRRCRLWHDRDSRGLASRTSYGSRQGNKSATSTLVSRRQPGPIAAIAS